MTHRQRAMAALFAGVLAIGFAPIGARLADIGPSATGFYRVLFALPALWLLAARERSSPASPQNQTPRTAGDFFMLGVTGLLFAADLSVWYWSLEYTSVANSTMLANLAPLGVCVVAWLVLKEKLSRFFAVGILLAVVGVAILAGNSFQLGFDHLFGDAIALVSALFYALYVFQMKHVRRRFSPGVILAWSSVVSCPAFFVAGWLMGDAFQPATLLAWGSLIGLGLITHVGGQVLISYALGRLSAGVTSAVLFLQPVIAALLAWVLLGESLGWLQAVGGSVALIGVLVATRPNAKKRPSTE